MDIKLLIWAGQVLKNPQNYDKNDVETALGIEDKMQNDIPAKKRGIRKFRSIPAYAEDKHI